MKITTKICARCKVEKPLDAFRDNPKTVRDGKYSYCRECCTKDKRARRIAAGQRVTFKPEITATHRECRLCHEMQPHDQFYKRGDSGKVRPDCKTCIIDRNYTNHQKRRPTPKPLAVDKLCGSCGKRKPFDEFYGKVDTWTAMCIPCTKVSAAEYRDANRSHLNALGVARRNNNIEHHRAKERAYNAANRGKRRAYQKQHSKTPGRRAQFARYNAKKRTSQTWPPCPLVDKIYALRDALTAQSGLVFHVDHIIPISKGGSHTWENLQVVPAFYNLSKGANI